MTLVFFSTQHLERVFDPKIRDSPRETNLHHKIKYLALQLEFTKAKERMRNQFFEADSNLWESRTRSLHLDGEVTSIRLENSFWCILESIAQMEDSTVPIVVTRLYETALSQGHNMQNFNSFLRFCCIRYQELKLNSQKTGEEAKISVFSLSDKPSLKVI